MALVRGRERMREREGDGERRREGERGKGALKHFRFAVYLSPVMSVSE